MILSIIVAVADNMAIGNNNALIWHISEDLRYFKSVTTGSTIIMGRKSYESIGRPLPNRRNIVVSRNTQFSPVGVEVASSIESAIELSADQDEVFIIGGGEIYRQSIDIADRLYITHVHHSYPADTHFPTINLSEWREVKRETFVRGEKFEHPFDFAIYERI